MELPGIITFKKLVVWSVERKWLKFGADKVNLAANNYYIYIYVHLATTSNPEMRL